jgi:hypothetical protein
MCASCSVTVYRDSQTSISCGSIPEVDIRLVQANVYANEWLETAGTGVSVVCKLGVCAVVVRYSIDHVWDTDAHNVLMADGRRALVPYQHGDILLLVLNWVRATPDRPFMSYKSSSQTRLIGQTCISMMFNMHAVHQCWRTQSNTQLSLNIWHMLYVCCRTLASQSWQRSSGSCYVLATMGHCVLCHTAVMCAT